MQLLSSLVTLRCPSGHNLSRQTVWSMRILRGTCLHLEQGNTALGCYRTACSRLGTGYTETWPFKVEKATSHTATGEWLNWEKSFFLKIENFPALAFSWHLTTHQAMVYRKIRYRKLWGFCNGFVWPCHCSHTPQAGRWIASQCYSLGGVCVGAHMQSTRLNFVWEFSFCSTFLMTGIKSCPLTMYFSKSS